MTRHKKQRLHQRRIELIKQLCDLSRDSWQHAKPVDYMPLEKELDEINHALSEKQRWRMVKH